MVIRTFYAIYCALLALASVTSIIMMVIYMLDGWPDGIGVAFAALFLLGCVYAFFTRTPWPAVGAIFVAPIGLLLSKLGFFISLGIPLILMILYHHGWIAGLMFVAAILGPGFYSRFSNDDSTTAIG